MESFAQLARRVTHRLAPDPVLRLDVEREIRCHLDDAFAANRSGGHPESEAASEALRAIGDETELSESLWQANRRRMRIRAWCRWAAQVLLVPAAIVVTVVLLPWWRGSAGISLALSSFGPWATSGKISGEDMAIFGLRTLGRAADFPTRPTAYGRDYSFMDTPNIPGLSGEARDMLACNPTLRGLPSAKRLVELHPTDPVLRVTYTLAAADPLGVRKGDSRSSPGLLRRLAVLDEAERVEPDNGLYDAIRAVCLSFAGAWPDDEASRLSPDRGWHYGYRDSGGRTVSAGCSVLMVHDQAALDEAMLELRRSAEKPKFSTYAKEMIARRLALLPNKTASDQFCRTFLEMGTYSPKVQSLVFLGIFGRAEALRLAVDGKGNEAMRLFDAVDRLGARIGEDATTVVEMLSAVRTRQRSLGHRVVACRILGWKDAEALAQAALDRDVQVFNEVYPRYWARTNPQDKRYQGILAGHSSLSIEGNQIAPEPMRTAENAMADSVLLQLLLLVINALLVCVGLLASGAWLLHGRGEHRPVQVFIGWQRLAKVLLLSVVAPLAAYGIYAHLTPLGGRQYGLPVSFERLATEYMLLLIVVGSTLLVASRRAIHARLQEAGFDVPPLARSRRLIIVCSLGLAIGFVAYLVVWNMQIASVGRPGASEWPAAGLGGIWLAVAFSGWCFWGMDRGGALLRLARTSPAYVGSVTRSLVPVAAAAVVLAGVAVGGAQTAIERSAISRAEKSGSVPSMHAEVERSQLRVLRDYFAREASAPMPNRP